MIAIEQMAGAARVAEVQPYPTRLYVREHGLVIEALKDGLVVDFAVPWADLADGTNAATANAFRSVRDAMKKGLADQKKALRQADAI